MPFFTDVDRMLVGIFKISLLKKPQTTTFEIFSVKMFNSQIFVLKKKKIHFDSFLEKNHKVKPFY